MNINDWYDFMPSRKQAHFGTNDQKDEFNYRKKVAQTKETRYCKLLKGSLNQ